MSFLATELVAAALLTVLMTLVHGLGVVAIAHGLKLDRERPRARILHIRTAAILAAVALMLFALHMVEIALFGLFYLAVGAVESVEHALFFSASAYSTLARPEADFPLEWRLVGALEGLIGFLLIGWSAAFFVTDMNRLLRD